MVKQRFFDWHDWNFQEYDKSADILNAFVNLQICEKTIENISLLGHAYYKVDWWTTDKAMLPWQIYASEPLIITFVDGSTFEIWPRSHYKVQMGSNRLTAKYCGGINYNNLNSKKFFAPLIGLKINKCYLHDITRITWEQQKETTPYHIKKIYQFEMCNSAFNYGLSISQYRNSWYSIELREQNYITDECSTIGNIQHKKLKSFFIKRKAIEMGEGYIVSASFTISPAIIHKGDDDYRYIEVKESDVFSIEDENIFAYLYFFLDKYLDIKIQLREEDDDLFAFYGHNLYTYPTIRAMIDEIRKFSQIFATDYDNKILEPIKTRFNRYTLDICGITSHDVSKHLTSKKIQSLYKENVNILTDFYERFCRRLEAAMRYAPDYDFIDFEGP